jgi:hypothetical protein
MIRTGIVALPLLAACSNPELSEGEARRTFESLNQVMTDLFVQAAASLVGGEGAQLRIETAGGDLAVSGELAESSWTGSVTVDGGVTSDADQAAYEITLSFDQVQMDRGPTLDGGVAFEFWADNAIDLDELAYSAGIGVDGALDVSGRDSGSAALEYDLALDVSLGGLAIEGEGTITGFSVADWDQLLPFSL